MHETDMTKALILTMKDWYREQSDKLQIEKIHLIVGEFTCVEPMSLKFAFKVQTRNTFLEGVELIIKDIPLIAFCHTCQQEYKPKIGLQYSCPDCQAPMEDIRSGRELKIDHIEYSTVAKQVISNQ
ncbi:MAG: hydrogenase maturation nickel metallochaperone HypA [Waterburya sp.]